MTYPSTQPQTGDLTMTNPETIVRQLACTTSTTRKRDIVHEELIADNREYFLGVRMAYDNSITFGVSTKTPKTGTGTGLSFADFVEAVQPLIERETTGDAAIKVLDDLAAKATQGQWHYWFSRIIRKNLDCGTNRTIVNKVVKAYGDERQVREYFVPVFECQLAVDVKNVSSAKTKKLTQVMVQPKLDGVRLLARVSKTGGTTLFSRSGKELRNFPRIQEHLDRCWTSVEHDVVWFDGEVVSASFQELMTQVNRNDDVQTDDCVFTIFDFMPDSAFKAGGFEMAAAERYETLRKAFSGANSLKGSTLALVESITLNYRGEKILLDALIAKNLNDGYEGTMIKDSFAPYVCKRDASWMKVKPTISITLEVVATVEGEGKYVGSLGALICEGEYNGELIRVSVGGGFSDAQRKEFWAHRGELINKIVEVKADAVSQSASGVYSLRFPRFDGFRGFELNKI